MLDNIGLYIQMLEKFAIVLGAFLYLIFALIVVKQTLTMTRNINDKFNYILIAFSYIHLFVSIFLILLTLIIL